MEPSFNPAGLTRRGSPPRPRVEVRDLFRDCGGSPARWEKLRLNGERPGLRPCLVARSASRPPRRCRRGGASDHAVQVMALACAAGAPGACFGATSVAFQSALRSALKWMTESVSGIEAVAAGIAAIFSPGSDRGLSGREQRLDGTLQDLVSR